MATAKQYIVDLKKDEKAELIALTQKGRSGARKIKRANILLLANTGKTDFEIAELLHTSLLTILRTRHRFVVGGLDFALNELPRAGRLPKIDDKVEISVMTEQCLDRRLGSQAIVASEVGAWEAERNTANGFRSGWDFILLWICGNCGEIGT